MRHATNLKKITKVACRNMVANPTLYYQQDFEYIKSNVQRQKASRIDSSLACNSQTSINLPLKASYKETPKKLTLAVAI